MFRPDDALVATMLREPKSTPIIMELEPLDRHVLVVAVSLPNNTWKACIGAVEGKDYDKEAAGVIERGSEIPLLLAEEVFEDLGKATRTGQLKWHKKENLRAHFDGKDYGPTEEWGGSKDFVEKR